jgi:hypothetical protein
MTLRAEFLARRKTLERRDHPKLESSGAELSYGRFYNKRSRTYSKVSQLGFI